MVRIVKPGWVQHGQEKNGKARPIFSIDIHPDGQRFVTAGGDNTIKIWSMAPMLNEAAEADPSAHKCLATLTQHTRPVNCVRWAGRSHRLASASDDNLALIWTLKPSDTGRTVGNLEEKQVENWRLLGRLQGHSHDVTDLAWAPDDTKLATCSLDNCVMVWDVAALQLIATLRHTSMVKGVAWDPMGKYISSASDDKSVAIWRCADWRQEKLVSQPYQKEGRTFFRRLSWSPDGVYIATSHGYKDPQHISPLLRRTKEFEIECDFVGHEKAIICSRFNPLMFRPRPQAPGENGSAGPAAGQDKHYTCVAIGSQDRSFSVWVASQVRPILVSQQFFEGSVLDISWGHDGYTMMCCAYDGTVVFFRFDPAELGALVSDDERQKILTGLYGGATNLSGRALSEIPESADHLDPAPAQSAAEPSGTTPAKANPWPEARAGQAAVNVLPTRQKSSGAAGAARAPATNGARAASASRPGGSGATGSSLVASSGGAAAAVHRPPVRKGGKGGKRRIAPVLVSPGAADSSSAFATASMQGSFAEGGGDSAAPAKRPRTMDVGSVPSQPAVRQTASSHSLAPQNSPAQPARQSQPRIAVVGGAAAAAPAVAVTAATGPADGEALVREVGEPPHLLIVEATVLRPVDEGVGHTTSTVRVSAGPQIDWEDTVHGEVSAVGGDGSDRGFVALGCTDGCVYTYTRRGRRMLPCLTLGGGGVSIVEVQPGKEASLLVVTVDGTLYLWSFQHGCAPRKVLRTSVAPLLSEQLVLTRALVTKSGMVAAVLSNGHAFGFDFLLDVWVRLVDNNFHESDFHSDLPPAALGSSAEKPPTDMAHVHAEASMAAKAAAVAPAPASRVAALMQAGSAGRRKQSISHLEALLGSAVLLGRGRPGSQPTEAAQKEFRTWLSVYARRLAEEGAGKSKRAEHCRVFRCRTQNPPERAVAFAQGPAAAWQSPRSVSSARSCSARRRAGARARPARRRRRLRRQRRARWRKAGSRRRWGCPSARCSRRWCCRPSRRTRASRRISGWSRSTSWSWRRWRGAPRRLDSWRARVRGMERSCLC